MKSDTGCALRPTDLPTSDGINYWPDGVPDGSGETAWDMAFEDPDGKEFRICYTDNQVIESARRSYGIFHPFIPFCMTKPILPP